MILFVIRCLTQICLSTKALFPSLYETRSVKISFLKLSQQLKWYLCSGNSIHYRHTNGCSFESVKIFQTENVSTWGGLEPPIFGLMPNALTIWAIRARDMLSHVFEHWLWRYRYFCSYVNSWNVLSSRICYIHTYCSIYIWFINQPA